MAESTINSGIKVLKKNYTLGSIQWIQSGAGKYYYTETLSEIPEGSKIIGVSIANWSSLRSTDIIGCYGQDRQIGIDSNTNDFGQWAGVVLNVLYI